MVNIEELAKASSHTGLKKAGYDDVKIDSNSDTAEKSKDSRMGKPKRKRSRDRTGQSRPQRSSGTTGDGTTQTTQFDDKQTLLTYTGSAYTMTTGAKTTGSKESGAGITYSKEKLPARTPQTPVKTPRTPKTPKTPRTPSKCKSNTMEEQKVERNAGMSPHTGGTPPRSGGKKSAGSDQKTKEEKKGGCCCTII